MFLACIFVSFLLVLLPQAHGHLSMEEPPARNVMWRLGYFDLPVHPEDDYLICTDTRQKPCPPCGDSADAIRPHPHEGGGEWATGIITRAYTIGQRIQVKVNVTKSHGGTLEFRLCPHNNPTRPVTQRCLDQHPLQIVDQKSNKVKLSAPKYAPYLSPEIVTVEVKLPIDITCDQCVLQMTNIAKEFKPSKVMFRNCADVAIQGTAKTNMAGGRPLDQPPPEFDLHTRSGFGPVYEEQKQYRFYTGI